MGSQQSTNLRPTPPFLPIDIKVLSLDFMVLVGLFLALESDSFFIDLSLGKYARFNDNLFFGPRVEVDLYSVIPLSCFFAVFIFSIEIASVVELILYLSVELNRFFDVFGTEDPFGHF